jgi:hypothetical protein
MQADQLVELILSHPKGGVAALLKITDSQEVDWLEFKASACDFPTAKESRTTDLQWRIARAVFAMANGRGGCVLIGIDDNAQAIGIEHSDPNNWIRRFGDDYFLRKSVMEQILRSARGWKTNAGRLVPDRLLPDFCADVRLEDYGGKRVGTIVVHPLPPGAPLLRIVNEDLSREFIPVRQLGQVGCVRELFREQEIRDHVAQRRLASPQYSAIWARFSTQLGDPISTLETEITAYLATVKERLCRLQQEFTHLDGKERRSGAHSHLTIPEAEEVLRWLDPDDIWVAGPAQKEVSPSGADQQSGQLQARVPRQGSVLALLRDEPRAILLGHPGSGKTTCLQRIVLDAAHAYCAGGHVTIFAPLAAYRSGGLFSLLRRVSNISLANLEYLAGSRRLTLLLDGLNECPYELANHCVSEIISTLERYPDLCLTLSTRTVSYREQLRLPTFVLRPMSEPQQFAMLSTRLGDSTRARNLLGQMKRVPGAASFVSNPQLLFVVSQVAQDMVDVPMGRALLYQAYVSEWFKREERKADHSGKPLEWNWPVALDALSHLAFRMRTRGRLVCDLEFARQTLEGIVPDPLHFIDRLAQGLLFIVDRFQGTFGFEHETIQEFLCACHLSAQQSSLATIAHTYKTNRDLWAMPIALLFELGEPSPEITQSLWDCDPLLVAVALRSDALLDKLDIKGCSDLWVRGLVHCLRGESVAETVVLKDRELSGPSDAVRDALRSDSFWYAGLTHSKGDERIRRLRAMIAEESEPWADLLRDAFVGHPAWMQEWSEVYDGYDGFLLVCSRIEALTAYVRNRKTAPANIPLQLLARLVYQLRVPAEVWASTSWFRRLFFDGPWFKLPTVLSVRQWKIAVAKGALGAAERRRNLRAQLTTYLCSMPALVPTLIRMQIITATEKLLAQVRQSCLLHLDEADAEYFVRNSLITRSDISHPVLDTWVASAGPLLSIAMIQTGFITIEVALSGSGRNWPTEKRRRFLRRLVELGLLTDKAFVRGDVCAEDLFKHIMVQASDPGHVTEPEPIPDSYIDEAVSVLEMPINGSSDLAYFLAAANLLSAITNRRRQERDLHFKRLLRDLVGIKRRIAEVLYRAAVERMDGVEVCLTSAFSYGTVFGVQFGFRELPVQRFAADLIALGLHRPQEWQGRRLQPIARSVMDWARQVRHEQRKSPQPATLPHQDL